MKQHTIAFLYNVRHSYPDPDDPRTQVETDFDDPETIEWIVRHMQEAGYAVIPIEANEEAYGKLMQVKQDISLVFNYAEGLHGMDRECHFPAILELLDIPYTGSGPLTQALVLNKAKTKEILIANGVATLPFQTMESKTFTLDPALHFPLIVKPLSQGSSAGITNRSVVHDKKQLQTQVKWVLDTFGGEVMIEPYINGREFSIGMMGNPPTILPIIEPNHDLLPQDIPAIDSLEVKWILEEQAGGNDYLQCPAKVSQKLERKLHELCAATWSALNLRDVCRIDIRCDDKENPYILEVNSPAGLIPPEISTTSYLALAARTAGISYAELIHNIITAAFDRCGIR